MYGLFKNVLDQNPLRALPLLALWLFIAVFLGVCVYYLVARRRGDFDSVAALPLDDEEPRR